MQKNDKKKKNNNTDHEYKQLHSNGKRYLN